MKKHFLLLILSLLFLPLAQGKVKLPAMMGDHMVLQQNSSVKIMGVGQTAKKYRHYFMEQPDLSGIYRQRRGLAGESGHSQRRLYTLFYYNQRWDSGHSLGYTDRGGVDLLRTVEHGNAHDGKCRTAH